MLYFLGYGSTECGAATIGLRKEVPHDLKSSGEVIPGCEIKISNNETNETLGVGEIGEIRIRGNQVTPGYLNRPQENKDLFDDENFWKSGDAGFYDEEGRVFIVDRLKQIIKFEGQQVAPSELEAILLTHKSVAEAAVVGLKHEIHGEVPKAFVVLRNGFDANEQELVKFVDDQVNLFKKLRGGITFVSQMPKTSSGKVNKSQLLLMQ